MWTLPVGTEFRINPNGFQFVLNPDIERVSPRSVRARISNCDPLCARFTFPDLSELGYPLVKWLMKMVQEWFKFNYKRVQILTMLVHKVFLWFLINIWTYIITNFKVSLCIFNCISYIIPFFCFNFSRGAWATTIRSLWHTLCFKLWFAFFSVFWLFTCYLVRYFRLSHTVSYRSQYQAYRTVFVTISSRLVSFIHVTWQNFCTYEFEDVFAIHLTLTKL